MTFGKLLRSLRNDRDISMRQLAKRSGLDLGYISRIEASVMKPPTKVETLQKISNVLELSEEEYTRLSDLAAIENERLPSDVEFSEEVREFVPILLRTVGDKDLDAEDFRKLARHLQEYKKELQDRASG